MTVVTMPRLVLEYLNRQSKAEDASAVIKATVRALRCCLWCFEHCIQFLTEYAYIHMAVTGRPFCRSAHASFVLFAQYPVQVGLDKMVCAALGFLACLTVPACLALLSLFVVDSDWSGIPCATFTFILAYGT